MKNADKIKLFAFDVDGTLTNGMLVLGPDGEAYKFFNVKDGLVLSLAHRMGYKTGFITGRSSKIVGARARELHADFVLTGVENKIEALEGLLKEYGLSWEEAAYMGDDLNDLPLLEKVGVSGCPENACDENRDAADFISHFKGGKAQPSEFVETYFESPGTLG